MRNISRPLGLAAVLVFALSGVASAATLGVATQPAGSFPGQCFIGFSSGQPDAFFQATDDPSTPYSVPAGGGRITQWQTLTVGDTAGAPITFLVLKPNSDGSYTVVAADSQSLPNPLPANGVASFALSTPITVTGGEVLGFYSSAAGTPSAPTCYLFGGSVPSGDSLNALTESSPPAAGQTLSPDSSVGQSPPGFTLNVAATLIVTEDAGVSASTAPSATTLGNVAVLSSTVSNGGPGSQPITFTDNVPSGLAIDMVQAGSASCTISGQKVSCSMILPPGQGGLVNILVTPTAAGSYTNATAVSLPSDDVDPNASNNVASANLNVSQPPTPPQPRCVVPRLRGAPSLDAQEALTLLGCSVGTITKRHDKHVPKGSVIRTAPGVGVYAGETTVNLVVSSGRKHHKHHKHHTRRKHHKHAVKAARWWRT